MTTNATPTNEQDILEGREDARFASHIDPSEFALMSLMAYSSRDAPLPTTNSASYGSSGATPASFPHTAGHEDSSVAALVSASLPARRGSLISIASVSSGPTLCSDGYSSSSSGSASMSYSPRGHECAAERELRMQKEGEKSAARIQRWVLTTVAIMFTIVSTLHLPELPCTLHRSIPRARVKLLTRISGECSYVLDPRAEY